MTRQTQGSEITVLTWELSEAGFLQHGHCVSLCSGVLEPKVLVWVYRGWQAPGDMASLSSRGGKAYCNIARQAMGPMRDLLFLHTGQKKNPVSVIKLRVELVQEHRCQ